jgi:adenylate cyclase class 2
LGHVGTNDWGFTVIEAELKAKLVDVESVRAELDKLASGRSATYRDAYFDHPAGSLDAAGKEVRLRTIDGDGGVRHLLTFKTAAVDEASGSKPEHETEVTDPDAVVELLAGVGCVIWVEFTKECVNYSFERGGRSFLATVVRVPEIDGDFLEVETRAQEGDVSAALDAVRRVFADLGVTNGELTNDTYTAAVLSARRGRPADAGRLRRR